MATKKMRAESFGSVDEFRAAVNLIAEKILAIRKEELTRDKAVQKILDERNAVIEALKQEAAGLLGLCDTYAKDHREEVFPKGTKTGETELCQYFLRLGAPALKALNGKWKEADIIKAAKDDPAWKSFVRVKVSLDKDAVKAAAFDDAELAAHGLRIEQTERLTVEPKVESL